MSKLNFAWNMTEKNWQNLISDHKLAAKDRGIKFSEDADVYGSCLVGNLCADIQHTLVSVDCYAFANVFALGVDDGYGETPAGIPYALLDGGPRVPMECESFEEFKKAFVSSFEEYIAGHKDASALAEAPLGCWD